ncbi:Uncharacterised protein [Burkholderia pseudomallei]|nr:hypothetical protein BURPSS13_O0004 [Burkholderia pseudomallei S13]KGD03178.1 putative membrane protein [Burkholderia pseudomallei]KGX20019.1 putative membrane protein [Burkholderia pseudomallei ABCPW 1]TOY77108.1 hypothetical protein DIJ62_36400 [Burkholderia pseudomallei]TOZ67922.1 hypothetical protein DIJ60_00455 [Burkholderia pseudomallei]
MLKRAWRGEERLWKVWWLLGMPLNLIGVAAAEWFQSGGLSPALILGLFTIYSALYFAWCNAVWGCSKNVDNRLWMYVARVLVVLGLIRYFQEVAQSLKA